MYTWECQWLMFSFPGLLTGFYRLSTGFWYLRYLSIVSVLWTVDCLCFNVCPSLQTNSKYLTDKNKVTESYREIHLYFFQFSFKIYIFFLFNELFLIKSNSLDGQHVSNLNHSSTSILDLYQNQRTLFSQIVILAGRTRALLSCHSHHQWTKLLWGFSEELVFIH